jgi:putative hydrolase of the HAD superfamily
MFDVIAFDADDTLWHTEHQYLEALDKLQPLLPGSMPFKELEDYIYRKETINIPVYGYGIKSYILSMLECAIELSDGQLGAPTVEGILNIGKDMLSSEVQLIERVKETLEAISPRYPLIVITKGELLEQQAKLQRSGIADYFRSYEVVSTKTTEMYQSLLDRLQLEPEHFLMVGNSLKSDILPVLELGGHAVFIPHEITWQHEYVEGEIEHPRYHTLEHIGQLPALLGRLEQEGFLS